MASDSRLAIYASIGANCLVAVAKFTAAAMTGSSAMLAEGLHSLVDAGDGSLLLVGRRRSRRPADVNHPFGHGKELYVWTLIVAMIFFAVGGGVSIYEGILHVLDPQPLADPTIAYAVLGVAFVLDAGSLVVAWRSVRRDFPGRSLRDVVRKGKDPSLFTVVLEDIADVSGVVIAAVGVWLSHSLRMPIIDGLATIGVGLVLAGVALVLVRESRALLVGERATDDVIAAVRESAIDDPAIRDVQFPLTMQMGPDEVLVTVSAHFDERLTTPALADVIERYEARVRARRPEVRHIFVEVTAGDRSVDRDGPSS